MSHLVIVRNNDARTAERIASFVIPAYLKSVKPEAIPSWLDNVGLHGRYMIWPADSYGRALQIASECKSAPNDFEAVKITSDPGKPLTAEAIQEIVEGAFAETA